MPEDDLDKELRELTIRGHTTRVSFSTLQGVTKYRISCHDCDFKSEAVNLEEARFDCRYHAIKQSIFRETIDWEQLL